MAAARSTARASAAPRRAAARPRAVPSPRPRGGAIRWDRVGRLIVLLAFGVVALLYVHPLWSMWSTRGEAAQRRAEVASLEAEHARLERRVKALKNPKALAREARALGMVRPTERGYVIQHLPAD